MTVTDAEYVDRRKQTRKELLLSKLDQALPWALIDFSRSPAFKIGEG